MNSHDPNDLVGPAGFVAPDQTLPYTIDFENDPKLATAPAPTVAVTKQLDPGPDLNTFPFGDLGFGPVTVHVPAGLSSYQTRVDATATLGVFVDVPTGHPLQRPADADARLLPHSVSVLLDPGIRVRRVVLVIGPALCQPRVVRAVQRLEHLRSHPGILETRNAGLCGSCVP